jgi:hypothetical protein
VSDEIHKADFQRHLFYFHNVVAQLGHPRQFAERVATKIPAFRIIKRLYALQIFHYYGGVALLSAP